MANESEEVVVEKEEEVIEEEGKENEGKEGEGKEPEKEKPAETPEARKSRLDRQTEQHKKKHPELYKDTPPKKEVKSDDLGYGELAFLTAKGIEDEDEIELVKSSLEESGKPLKELLSKKWFQDELKELRAAKTTADATPSNTKRNGQSASDTVEYWIAKGELPKDKELARKVVNARIDKEKKTSVFD